MCSAEEPYVVHEDVVEVINYIRKNRGEGAILCFLPGWDDIMKVKKLLPHLNDGFVLCLHSRLQDSEQRKIFSRAPPGIRKIILATNIAETSVTVDDVVFVIDTGIHKEQRFDPNKGTYVFIIKLSNLYSCTKGKNTSSVTLTGKIDFLNFARYFKYR